MRPAPSHPRRPQLLDLRVRMQSPVWICTLHSLACWMLVELVEPCIVQDVVFSFPVTCKGGDWTIVQGLDIDEKSAAKLKATGDELVEEKQLALQCLQE